jgi:hypothetical protein
MKTSHTSDELKNKKKVWREGEGGCRGLLFLRNGEIRGHSPLKSTCDVNLLSKLSIIFKEWRVMNNVDRGGVIVLFIL